ncbi:MAG TPA: SagB family peptide dehydrogenase [Vicinamibacterales bacterium]|nr:SagB family peptide dehydrogenase [Vicinamibacterales bacterium]
MDCLFRRSPFLVAYWSDERLLFHNFATGRIVSGTALTIGLLDYFSTWKAAAPLLEASSFSPTELDAALQQLSEETALQRSDRPTPIAESAMESWQSWNPAAGFFHFSTKDVVFSPDLNEVNDWHLARVAERPIPEPIKKPGGRTFVQLPREDIPGTLDETLRQRRTWRRFGSEPVSVGQLGTVLDLTFGVRHWMDLGMAGHAMLRTSPSAGARNPLEAYVVVRNVSTIQPGVYHYGAADHRLTALNDAAGRFVEYLPGQPWYSEAHVLVLMTAVFERTEWKYPFARAYRTILLEAGHFAQTFCLVATALKLAPFCTAALADSLIEQDLGIDGVTESVIYACGFGTRPPGTDWAPWPDAADIPALLPPSARKTPSKP